MNPRQLIERVADNVQWLRVLRHWTQKELAERAHLTPAAVSQIEGHKRAPSLSSMAKLATAMDIEPSLLFADPSSIYASHVKSQAAPEREER